MEVYTCIPKLVYNSSSSCSKIVNLFGYSCQQPGVGSLWTFFAQKVLSAANTESAVSNHKC